MNLILAVAIATIGAFHDMNYLDAKKELVEITGHPELVTDSAGGDFSDHVVPERPKAKTYLNKANRRIEESLVELQAQEMRRVQIGVGQYTVPVSDLRYVSRVEIEDATSVKALGARTWSWVREHFKIPLRAIINGTPLWWIRRPITVDSFTSVHPSSTAENSEVGADETHIVVSLSDGSEGAVIYDILSGTPTPIAGTFLGASIGGGEVYLTGSGVVYVYSKAGVLLRQFSVANVSRGCYYNGEYYALIASEFANQVKVYTPAGVLVRSWAIPVAVQYVQSFAVSSGGVVLTSFAVSGGGNNRLYVFSHTGLTNAVYSGAGTGSMQIIAATSDRIYWRYATETTARVYNYALASTTGLTLTYPSTANQVSGAANSSTLFMSVAGGGVTVYSFDLTGMKTASDLIILPPTDQACVLNVYGGYYAHAFESETDETWASVNCPGALLLMAKAYVCLFVEGDHNSFKTLEKQALLEAIERWSNSVYEHVDGIPIEEQRFGPVSFGKYAGSTGEAPMYQWDDA